jgi:hypothetical protein
MTMSKPMTRIVVSVLIALALLVAIYTSVQGGLSSNLLKSEANSAQAHVVNGLKTNLNHDRSTAAELESAAFQADKYMQPGGQGHGGCEDELRVDPSD